ncbi:hypothetical protein ACFQDG_19545 [Natronoarchaeum mannanilyticum]|uniref:Uncharacterized protein n=1 Tax=Natronoarchaeum mannanilyticum TaxID=926360 RepID=A0AAV3T5Z4_9EURY
MRGTRGAVLPIPALLAAAVVCLGLSLYATTLHERTPGQERSVIRPATADALEAASGSGIVEPARLDDALATIPGGYEANLTVRAEGERWSAGPAPPSEASADDPQTAIRVVTVRVGQGQFRPGEFEVVLWS